jgi:hypothetical protein
MSANDSGPFRKSAAPPGPPPPPRFSPLRPLRAFGRWLGHFLWWSLTFSTVSWQDVQSTDAHGRVTAGSEPTGFGCLGGIVAIIAVIITITHLTGLVQVPWWTYFWGGAVLLRSWLRAAMHLDEPESLAWWQEKLS